MRAAERIGKGAEEFAVHSGGQEMGMHDPKLDNAPGLGGKAAAAMYKMDATPGRHTQGGELIEGLGVDWPEDFDKYT